MFFFLKKKLVVRHCQFSSSWGVRAAGGRINVVVAMDWIPRNNM